MVNALSPNTPTNKFHPIEALQAQQSEEPGDEIAQLLEHIIAADAEEGTTVVDFRYNSEMLDLIERVKTAHPAIFGQKTDYIWQKGPEAQALIQSLQNAELPVAGEPHPAMVNSEGKRSTLGYNIGMEILGAQNKFYDMRSDEVREMRRKGLDETGAEAEEIDKLLAFINAANTEGGPKSVDFKDNEAAKKLIDSVRQKHPEIFGENKGYSWKKGKETENLLQNLQNQVQTLHSKQQRIILQITPAFEEICVGTEIGRKVANKADGEIEHTLRNTGK